MATRQEAERQEAIAKLRTWCQPGDTLYTVLSRVIQVIKIEDGEPVYLGWHAAIATGMPYDAKREGVRIGGCGMDMGFAIVSDLSYYLYPDGFECIGEKCPSNDHHNGDRNYAPHHHKSGDYALRHRWL